MTTGQLIKAARKNAGMTQAELASKLNVPYQSISQWERGTRNPKYDTLERLADALDVPLEVLLGIGDYDGSIRVHVSPEQQEYSELLEKKKNGSITSDELSRLLELHAKRPPLSESIKQLGDILDRLGQCMKKLNVVGQQKVENYAQDLTRIPEYQAKQSTPPTDTTPPTDAPERPQGGE